MVNYAQTLLSDPPLHSTALLSPGQAAAAEQPAATVYWLSVTHLRAGSDPVLLRSLSSDLVNLFRPITLFTVC